MGQNRSGIANSWALVHVWVSTALACAAPGERRGEPLYPEPSQPLSRDEVAVLSGYVAIVDDRDVSEDTGPFELLPGCHVVRTPQDWGAFEPDGELRAETGVLPFVLPMKAGHSYQIKLTTAAPHVPQGTYVVEAIETDATGQPGQVFLPVAADDAECD